MDILISYDVSGRQPEVKKALQDLKYSDYWTDKGQSYYLPNTTLWKKGIGPAVALQEIQGVIARLNQGQLTHRHIRLERCVCVLFTVWSAISGDQHSG